MKAVREELGPDVPMVAVFDTAFHSTLPEHAYTYALPHDLSRRGEMRRYGFHGTAHEYMLKRYADLRNISSAAATLVTLQLGNGCSAAAIKNGKSVDTSMGFTPLEGLVMGTRSGDVDPGLIGYIAEKEGMSGPEVIDLLNKKAGLLGLSGSTSDMRSLIEALPSQPAARLAVDVFCYRVRKYIGAYLAVLGGAGAVIFGGGIGENAALIRARILDDMEWCGLKLSPARNEAVTGKEGLISADDSPVEIYVIRVDESLLIAEHTVALVSGKPGNQGSNETGL
jgi:acetate kinase